MGDTGTFLGTVLATEGYLRSLGYNGTLAEMTAHYQWFNGLKSDGVIGPQTIQLLRDPRRCGMPDLMQNRDCKWNRADVVWRAQLELRQMSTADAASVFEEACLQWNAVCGIRLQRASRQSAVDIHAEEGEGRRDDFDGPGGTLAWSELPCGRERMLQQRYDVAENWHREFLLAVVCHEVGHAIGIPHIRSGNLMAPYYDPAVTKPQEGDIAEAVRRYGPPATSPVDPPPGPVDSELPRTGHVVLDLGGHLFEGTVTRAD